MSINLKIQKLLKETENLLQDIECELHFRLPHSKKLADIRNMVLWLKGGDPIAAYDFSLQEQELEWPEAVSDPFAEPFESLENMDEDKKK